MGLALLLALAASPGVTLGVGAFSARPSWLEAGLLAGPSLSAEVPLGPFDLGVRARLGFAAESDLVFEVEHVELQAAVSLGAAIPIGRGEVAARLALGPIGLFERRARHHADRLEAAGQAGGSTGAALGLLGAAELAVRLDVVHGFWLECSGGPTLVVAPGSERAPLGYSFGVAARRSFSW